MALVEDCGYRKVARHFVLVLRPTRPPFLPHPLVTPSSRVIPLVLKPLVADMDLVCLIDNKEAALHASDLVAMIGDLLERGKSSGKTSIAKATDRVET